jgi:cell division protein FtsZ
MNKKKTTPPKKKTEIKEKKIPATVHKAKIKIIGIGGGGGSIVKEISSRLSRVDFVVANTDLGALKDTPNKVKTLAFGQKLTDGYGTGMDPNLGAEAAQQDKEKIQGAMKDCDICILIASLGGGTGSGATPVFARLAKEVGCLTYGIFTLPFEFEGGKKMEMARDALEKTQSHINALTVLPNEGIFQMVGKDTPLSDALSVINKELADSLEGLIQTIYEPGLINIDFADLRTVLEGRGRLCYLHTLVVKDDEKTEEGLKKALHSPLYSYDISGSKSILFNVCGNKGMGLKEVSRISSEIASNAKNNAKIIFGVTQGTRFGSGMRITVLATGCEADILPKSKEEKKKVVVPKKKTKRRKTAVDIKKEVEDEKGFLNEEEKVWETPAFLRNKDL